jgi:hypothetical protein
MSYNEDEEVEDGFKVGVDDDEPLDMPEGIEIPEDDDDPENKFH